MTAMSNEELMRSIQEGLQSIENEDLPVIRIPLWKVRALRKTLLLLERFSQGSKRKDSKGELSDWTLDTNAGEIGCILGQVLTQAGRLPEDKYPSDSVPEMFRELIPESFRD